MVLFCRFAGLFESAGGVFVGLTGQLVGGETALVVRSRSGGMGMCGEVVVLGGSVVGTLAALDISSGRLDGGARLRSQRPNWRRWWSVCR